MNNLLNKITLLFLFISIPSLISIKAQEFKSLAAKDALAKYQSAIKKAEEQYKKDLEAALASATKNGNLEEANLIKATLDGKEVVKEEIKETDKPKSPLVLIDKHNCNAGSKSVDTIYNLVLKKEQGKKVFLIISLSNLGTSFGNIYLNNETIGKWATAKNSEKSIEIDITKLVTGGFKKYEVEFKWETGPTALFVSEVKAEFR